MDERLFPGVIGNFMHILVVEDDDKMAGLLSQGLQEAGFGVQIANDGVSALAAAMAANYDAIVLDVMLPKLDGWEVLRSLRRAKTTPVIMLTARDSVAERVKGLQAGADDYLIKPFAFVELLARVQSLLRRGSAANAMLPTVFKVADLELDIVQRHATRSGARIELTAQEFCLLSLFMKHVGTPLSRAMIAREVWGIHFQTDTNIVEVAVRRLRSKMDNLNERRLIHTLRGIGYILEDRKQASGSANAD
jgi:two-component system copper resistance phosphate regulon response regulator CusR